MFGQCHTAQRGHPSWRRPLPLPWSGGATGCLYCMVVCMRREWGGVWLKDRLLCAIKEQKRYNSSRRLLTSRRCEFVPAGSPRVTRRLKGSPIEPLIDCSWSSFVYWVIYGVRIWSWFVCNSPICTCIRDTYGMSNHRNRDDSLDISCMHFALYAWCDTDFRLRSFVTFLSARFIFRLSFLCIWRNKDVLLRGSVRCVKLSIL